MEGAEGPMATTGMVVGRGRPWRWWSEVVGGHGWVSAGGSGWHEVVGSGFPICNRFCFVFFSFFFLFNLNH